MKDTLLHTLFFLCIVIGVPACCTAIFIKRFVVKWFDNLSRHESEAMLAELGYRGFEEDYLCDCCDCRRVRDGRSGHNDKVSGRLPQTNKEETTNGQRKPKHHGRPPDEDVR